MAALEDLLATHPQGSRISPRALARVLGKLNFASMVVEAGEVFLSRLYDMFRGVVVDWKRGLVRFEGPVVPTRQAVCKSRLGDHM